MCAVKNANTHRNVMVMWLCGQEAVDTFIALWNIVVRRKGEPMSDLISRQAAIEINQSYHGQMPNEVNYRIWKEIKELPSIQPEIIRCKECKYWQDQEEGIVEVQICARPANKYEKFPLVMLIGGDGFCSYAERKENR